MIIVNIISSLERINFGIWNSAFFAAGYLQQRFGYRSIGLVCTKGPQVEISDVKIRYVDPGDPSHLDQIISEEKLSTHNSVIVSHGAWLRPAMIGSKFARMGFTFVYVPHGMLEPWSMQQNRLKKILYFYAFEKRAIRRAHAIRAVSRPEQLNLQRMLARDVSRIPNGVSIPDKKVEKESQPVFLFMARLHMKKGILPLVRAWQRAMQTSNAKLIIAGPDEGELDKIRPFLSGNIEYAGAVYGPEKHALLSRAHYYALPSFSEGFPTSVLEAMSHGAIPLISKGCNFPDVFENDLGFNIEPDEDQIAGVLAELAQKPFDNALSQKNCAFIAMNYSETVIGEQLHALYASLLNNK